MRILFFLAALLAIQGPPEREAQQIARALEARYQRARTLQADFLERYSQGKEGTQIESGTVYFSRPGRMRWEYESPESKLFLVDGKNVWFYVPADRTASRAKLKESADWRTPLALLAGKVNLLRICKHIELVSPGSEQFTPIQPGDKILSCLPQTDVSAAGDELFREALFEVDAQDHLARVLIREPGEIETEFRFGNWRENIPIAETKFHFEPPPGVAIVDEAQLSGEIH